MLPAKPGVYLMKNAQAQIIYIGKAKLLNKRVRSYFDNQEKTDHRAAMLMVPHITNIEWIITESETEALILEANLIAKHKPHYNVRQKDDKHFPYLMLTMQEEFPRLKITRHVRDDKNIYFGPFINSRYIKVILDLASSVFYLRECKLKLPQKKNVRACLNFYINRCKAPCVKMISKDDYMKNVQSVKMLLEGKSNDVLNKWKIEMQTAATEMRFEDAAKLRDQIDAVKSVFEKQKADATNADLNLDIIAISRLKSIAIIVIIEYRNGILYNRRYFNLEDILEQSEAEILAEFLPSWYINVPEQDIPREIALEISLGSEQILLEELLTGKVKRNVHINIPQRGNKLGYLRIAKANAEMLLVEEQAKQTKYEKINISIFELQKELQLDKPPFCIECFDVSHLNQTEPVASMVRFINGVPSKNDYRKFKIKTAVGGDDYGSLHEVLTRRLTRLKEENEPMPDLIVVDGGKGQVNTAFNSIAELNLTNIPVIGLAERLEEIVFPKERQSLLLKRNNTALQLLQRIRDEAHRFAITFQRNRRKL